MIHRNRFLQCVLSLALPFLAVGAVAQAPYSSPPVGEYPAQLVVKFKADQHFDTKMKGGRLSTGKVELDQLNDKYETQSQDRLLKRPVTMTYDNPLRDVYILRVPQGTDLEAMAREYEQLDIVEYAHPDYLYELHSLPDDPLLEHQWALVNTGQGHYHVERLEGDFNDTLAIVYGTPGADIHAGPVFEAPPDQTDVVVVAIIDTGIDADHPDLVGKIWANPGEIPGNGIDDDHNSYADDTRGWDFCANDTTIFPLVEDNEPDDYIGHGTHCAGIVASSINNGIGVAGTAPEARIMALRVFPWAMTSNITRAIVYAVDNGADVISMSFGGGWPTTLMENALIYARSRGVLPLASAGNSGSEATNFPATYDEVMCITASNDLDQITSWSTFSPNADVCAPGQSILSLRAEGTDLYADHNEPGVHIIDSLYYLASGTSMSCPYAAGVAAYVRSVSPGLIPDSLQALLESTADDIIDPYGLGEDYPGWDMYSGHGRVNLAGALAAAPRVRAIINSPDRFDILSGTVDIHGSADGEDFGGYVLEYAIVQPDAQWIELASSSETVTDGVLGTIETGSLDGPIDIRLRVGSQNSDVVTAYAANTVKAEIISPSENESYNGWLTIKGKAHCPEFRFSVLEYGSGVSPSNWQVVDTVGVPAYGGVVSYWETTTIPNGVYSLRLMVYSMSGLELGDTVTFLMQTPFLGEHGWTAALDSMPGICPNYGDFDGDGINELVIGTHLGVQFFNLDGSPKTTGVPEFAPGNYRIVLAVGNLDGDNVDDLVAMSISGVMYGFPSTAPPFTVTLDEAPPVNYNYRTGNRIYLKDINNDGLDEIHFYPAFSTYTNPPYYYLFRPDGTAWGNGFPPPATYSICFPADLDGNLIDEIYCYNDSNGYLVEFDTLGQGADSVQLLIEDLPLKIGQISLSAVDIDGDLVHELIIFGFAADPVEFWITTDQYVFAIDDGPQLLDGWPHNTAISGTFVSSHPKFGDLDSDGQLEYFMYFGNDPGGIYAWHLDGTPYTGDSSGGGFFTDAPNPGYMSDMTVIDVGDDGVEDIVTAAVGSEIFGYPVDRIIAFDGTGQMVEGFPMVVATGNVGGPSACPTVGDINQDGFVDLAYVTKDSIVFANLPGRDYYASKAPWPMRRGNRRQNATARLTSETTIPCGDINGSGQPTDIADLVYMVDYMFNGGPEPPVMAMADVDGSGGGNLDIADLVYLVDYMFNQGPEPVCQ